MAISLFISYKREDLEFAKELKQRIDTADIDATCWYDQYIPPGDPWKQAIDKEIESCTGVILVVTVAALKSGYVTYEWSYAMGAGKRVIPLVLEIPDKAKHGIEMHAKLDENQTIFFNDGYKWDLLIKKLRQLIRDEYIPPDIAEAEKLLYYPDHGVSEGATEFLLENDHPQASESLARAAQSSAREVSRRTALALARSTNSQDRRAIPGLLRYLDTDLPDRADAMSHLIEMENPEVIQAVWEILSNITDEHRRSVVIFPFTKFRGPRVVPMLCDLLLIETNARNFEYVVEALGEHRDPRATTTLLEYINKHPPEMNLNPKIKAVQALEQIADPTAVDPLIEIWSSDSKRTKTYAKGVKGSVGQGLQGMCKTDVNGCGAERVEAHDPVRQSQAGRCQVRRVGVVERADRLTSTLGLRQWCATWAWRTKPSGA